MTRIILAAALCCVTAGCNPVARISANATKIRNEAGTLIDHGNAIGDPVVVESATRIDGYASDIHGDIPSVQAVTPAWLSTIHWWGIAVAFVAVAFILWRSGALTAVRIAIGWLPRRKVTEAELAAKMLGNDEETPREYVAAKRGSDELFDAAWRKINKEKP
jgi:hypothetical protein